MMVSSWTEQNDLRQGRWNCWSWNSNCGFIFGGEIISTCCILIQKLIMEVLGQLLTIKYCKTYFMVEQEHKQLQLVFRLHPSSPQRINQTEEWNGTNWTATGNANLNTWKNGIWNYKCRCFGGFTPPYYNNCFGMVLLGQNQQLYSAQ